MTTVETRERQVSHSPATRTHPMDPAHGGNLTPAFAALLCWAIGREPMTRPAIVGIRESSGCIFAATTDSPFHDTLVGSTADVERNLRDWGEVTGTPAAIVDGIVDKLRRASR